MIETLVQESPIQRFAKCWIACDCGQNWNLAIWVAFAVSICFVATRLFWKKRVPEWVEGLRVHLTGLWLLLVTSALLYRLM